jgi:5-enolpyruvylshikimate-3-phosphate synthase
VPPWERRKQFEAENLQAAVSGTLLRILWGECGVSKHSHIVLQGDELIVICPQLLGHPFKFLHADPLIGAKVRVSGAGGRYPSALCRRCVL